MNCNLQEEINKLKNENDLLKRQVNNKSWLLWGIRKMQESIDSCNHCNESIKYIFVRAINKSYESEHLKNGFITYVDKQYIEDKKMENINNKNLGKKSIHERIDNDFTYHCPPPEIAINFPILRNKAKELAYLIIDLVPSGREQSTALTRLEEAIMHANAGIARQYPKE